MYEKYFGLKQMPFNLTPDPEIIYLSDNFHEGVESLKYSISRGEGFIVVTGEVGTGKTTLSRFLMEELKTYKHYQCYLISNPFIAEEKIFDLMATNFSDVQNYSYSQEQSGPQKQLEGSTLFTPHMGSSSDSEEERALVEAPEGVNTGRRNLLVIDEAHKLSVSLLERLSILSNIETNKEKLLQIVLIGQPELAKMLDINPSLKQLKQRITVHYQLKTLKKREVEKYIYHRLSLSGNNGNLYFTQGAVKAIYRNTKGCQREVNVVADRSLLIGYMAKTYRIDGKIVKKAIQNVHLSTSSSHSVLRNLASVTAGVMFMLFLIFSVPFFKNVIARVETPLRSLDYFFSSGVDKKEKIAAVSAAPVSTDKIQGSGIVTLQKTSVYKFASGESSVLTVIDKSSDIRELYNDGDWIKIQTSTGDKGWIESSMVKLIGKE